MFVIKAKEGGETFTIYRDDVVDKSLKVNSPKLELVENSAGSLTFKMPPSNAGYDKIELITTVLTLYKSDTEIWEGRIISIKEDFNKNKTVTAEGQLAYLNDTVQPQQAYTNISLSSLLNQFLTKHNSQVDSSKKMYLGNFTHAQNWDYNTWKEVYTNYDSTMKSVVEKIINMSNGYISLRKVNGNTYIDHTPFANRPVAPQIIRFGKNLLDFTKSYDSTSMVTAILPLGERIDSDYGFSTSGIEGVQAYTTVESVNGGSPYVSNAQAVAAYGWIVEVVHFDEISNKSELLQYAQNYLSNIQYDSMTLEVSAVDLSYMDVDYTQLQLHQLVRVISEPHGLDRYFPITKISIPLDNPANTTFSMGAVTSTSIVTRTARQGDKNSDAIRDMPSMESILYNARVDAGNLISGFDRGYITITRRNNGSNELYITENPIPENYNADNPTGAGNINKYWRWNMNGLEYVNKTKNIAEGLPENTPLVAIDMEGRINASMINTGSLNANIIQAGIIKNAEWNCKTLHIGFDSRSKTELNCDWIILYYYDSTIGKYRASDKIMGDIGDFQAWIPSASFYIYWHTDGSVVNWGWKISYINSVEFDASLENASFPNIVDSLPSYTSSRLYTGIDTLPESEHNHGNNVNELITWNTNKSDWVRHGNQKFYFNLENGEFSAKDGYFSGTINGSTINGSTINGTVINGSSMNISGAGHLSVYLNNGNKVIDMSPDGFTTYYKTGGASFMNKYGSWGQLYTENTNISGVSKVDMWSYIGFFAGFYRGSQNNFTDTYVFDTDPYAYFGIGGSGTAIQNQYGDTQIYPPLYIVNNYADVNISSHKWINLQVNDKNGIYDRMNYYLENEVNIGMVATDGYSGNVGSNYRNHSRIYITFKTTRARTSQQDTRPLADFEHTHYFSYDGLHLSNDAKLYGDSEGRHTGSIVLDSDSYARVYDQYGNETTFAAANYGDYAIKFTLSDGSGFFVGHVRNGIITSY